MYCTSSASHVYFVGYRMGVEEAPNSTLVCDDDVTVDILKVSLWTSMEAAFDKLSAEK